MLMEVGEVSVELLLVIELQVHPVVNLVVLECDVILENCVPLFQDNFVPLGTSLKHEKTIIVLTIDQAESRTISSILLLCTYFEIHFEIFD